MLDLRRREFVGLVPAALAGAPAAKGVEARAVWLHMENMFDADPAKGREQVRATVQRFAESRFNLILPWVVSDYLVALEAPAYQQAHPTARWDALGALIQESARAGLAVDIWYAFTEYRNRNSSDYDPRVGGNPNWAARRINELLPDPKTGQIAPRKWEDVCAQHPEARRWQLNLLTKALDRYPKLNGIHIEEPGYTYQGNCVCELCQEVFPRIYGSQPPYTERLATPEAEDFRTLGTSAFMEALLATFKQRGSKIIFSANGGYNWRSDRRSGRDWGRWARSGWLDYYASQVYVTKTDLFRQRLSTTVKDLAPECTVYGGIAFAWSGGKNTVDEVIRQVEASREVGAGGVCLFYAGAFTDELHRALRTGPFRDQASLPPRHRTA